MITFVWFTRTINENILLQSIRSVVENVALEKKLHIVFENIEDQEGYKITGTSDYFKQSIQDTQDKFGVVISQEVSTFNRKRNLNGTECVAGMLGIYKELAKDSDAVFKIDDDVVIFKSQHIARFMNIQNWLSLACHVNITTEADAGFFYGAIYGLKKELINLICENAGKAKSTEDYIRTITSNVPEIQKRFPEDRTFSVIIRKTIPSHKLSWVPFSLERGFLKGWQYQNRDFSKAFKPFDCVTFGNRSLINTEGYIQINEVMAETMSAALDEQAITKNLGK